MKEIKETTEIQKIILAIQTKVHAFCEKHRIAYSLSGGTCIGAVRHKGFIPCDDDIDMFLTRRNYEHFLQAFEKDPIPGLRLATFRNRKRFFVPFAKIEDERTEILEFVNNPSEIGVNIDLFPLSGLPNNAFLRKAYLAWCKILRSALAFKQVKIKRERNFGKNLILWFGRSALCVLPLKFLLSLMDKTSRLCDDEKSDFVCEIFSGVTKPFPRAAMAGCILMPFEDKVFSVMSGYDAYLRATYGDYMQLPPPEKRVTHHAFTAYWKE